MGEIKAGRYYGVVEFVHLGAIDAELEELDPVGTEKLDVGLRVRLRAEAPEEKRTLFLND